MLSLKIKRIKEGFTQKELAKKSGVGVATIHRIEKNGIETIPVYTLRKLAKALNTTVHELFFSEDD